MDCLGVVEAGVIVATRSMDRLPGTFSVRHTNRVLELSLGVSMLRAVGVLRDGVSSWRSFGSCRVACRLLPLLLVSFVTCWKGNSGVSEAVDTQCWNILISPSKKRLPREKTSQENALDCSPFSEVCDGLSRNLSSATLRVLHYVFQITLAKVSRRIRRWKSRLLLPHCQEK